MSGVWSVDSILSLPEGAVRRTGIQDPYLVRMVHYTPNPTNAVGVRHLLVSGELIAGGDGLSRLDFGRAFRPGWARLRDPELHAYLLTPNNLRALPEAPGVETGLRNAIDGALEESGVLEGGELPGPFLSPLRIHVLNVGQGDTILLQLPNGKFWLVDAFSWSEAQFDEVTQYLGAQGCDRLEKLIISHFHYDHIRRARDILRIFRPSEVWVPTHTHPTSTARNLVIQAGVRLKRLTSPIVFRCGEYDLHVAPTTPLTTSKDPNEHGIVLYIKGEDGTALLPGDVPGPLLGRLITSMSWPFSHHRSIYKVTHHCSATGNDSKLLGLIHPSEAATSCALTNRYGHPDFATKQAIEGGKPPCVHRFTFNQKQPLVYHL